MGKVVIMVIKTEIKDIMVTIMAITMVINSNIIQIVHIQSSHIFSHPHTLIKDQIDLTIRIWDQQQHVSQSMLILMVIFSKQMLLPIFMMFHHHKNANKNANINANVSFLYGKLLPKIAIFIMISKILNG